MAAARPIGVVGGPAVSGGGQCCRPRHLAGSGGRRAVEAGARRASGGRGRAGHGRRGRRGSGRRPPARDRRSADRIARAESSTSSTVAQTRHARSPTRYCAWRHPGAAPFDAAPVPQGDRALYFLLAASATSRCSSACPCGCAGPPIRRRCISSGCLSPCSACSRSRSAGAGTRSISSSTGPTSSRIAAAAAAVPALRLVFPERPQAWVRIVDGRALVPLLYCPALLLGGARVASFARADGRGAFFSRMLETSTASSCCTSRVCLLGGLAILVRALAPRPFGDGTTSAALDRLGHELRRGCRSCRLSDPVWAGFDVAARGSCHGARARAVPLAFASAIVRYRLMDVEVIIKRGLVYAAAVVGDRRDLRGTAARGGRGVLRRFPAAQLRHRHAGDAGGRAARPAGEERHSDDARSSRTTATATTIAARWSRSRAISTATSISIGSANVWCRASSKRWSSIAWRCMLGASCDDEPGVFATIRAAGFDCRRSAAAAFDARRASAARLLGGPHRRARRSECRAALHDRARSAFWRDTGIHYFVPCVSKEGTIAVMALGRKESGEPLNSEDMALLAAVAGQVATALENGRLYRQLRLKADELDRMREFSENILESLTMGCWSSIATSRCCAGTCDGVALRHSARQAMGQQLDVALRSSVPRDPAAGPARRRKRRHRSVSRRADVPPCGRPAPLLVNAAAAPLQMPEGGAAGHHPHHRGHHRARPTRGAAPDLREDGVDRPARRGRGPRGEHAAHGHLELHADAAAERRQGGSDARSCSRRSSGRRSAPPRSSMVC